MNSKHIFGVYFALAYVLACIIISILHIGGGWGIMYMIYLAAPFSILSGVICIYIENIFGNFIPTIVFLAMNTIWWYFLGRLFYYIKNKKIDH
jgi:hypothetical protein